MKKVDLVQNTITAILVLCAVVTTSLIVRREFFGGSAGERTRARPSIVADWRSYAASGHRAGPADAVVTLVEFSDFQCPFCAVLASRLDTLREEYPRDFAVVYHHAPLSIHQHAVAAAKASECAGEQGRFWQFHDALFQKQDSIGKLPWKVYASAAGIPDMAAFERCTERPGAFPALRRDSLAVTRLGVNSTPTILIGEQRLDGVPPLDTLRAYIQRAVIAAPTRTTR